MPNCEDKIESLSREHFGTDSGLFLLDSICWQVQQAEKYTEQEVLDKKVPELIIKIALRYPTPISALRIIDEGLSHYFGYDVLPRLRLLSKRDGILFKNNKALLARSLQVRLEESLYRGQGLRNSYGAVGSPRYIKEDMSPSQENALRILEEAR